MKEYRSEEEFLKDYNPDEFKKLSLTTDILVLSVSSNETNNYRKTDDKKMSVLLVKRDSYPFKDMWCLPGGFVGYDEDLDDAPVRILKRETNLDNIFLEQLYTFGNAKRDPRMRIEKNNLVTIVLDNGETTLSFTIKKKLKEETTDRYEFVVVDNKSIAFDHPLVILSGLERLKNKLEYTDIVFNMMPKYFTLGELQKVYEVILGKKLLDPAFRRIIKDKVKKTNKMKTGEGHRPSVLFEYNK